MAARTERQVVPRAVKVPAVEEVLARVVPGEVEGDVRRRYNGRSTGNGRSWRSRRSWHSRHTRNHRRRRDGNDGYSGDSSHRRYRQLVSWL